MRKVTLRGLFEHKLRLALTALAVALAVTFISGTLVLTDTLNRTYTALTGNAYQHVDFVVRGEAQFSGSAAAGSRRHLPASLLTRVRGVPGVGYATGQVEGYAQFVAKDGKAVQPPSGLTTGISYEPDQQLSTLRLTAGRAPQAADDVVMDEATAQRYGFSVGQRVKILFLGPAQTFTISGIAQSASLSSIAAPTVAAFTLPAAQRAFAETGQLDSIDVLVRPGADKALVGQDIARILPAGVQVVTGQAAAKETMNSLSQSLSFISTSLLVFAFVALFVGGFTILNTFSIIVGQRTRELALLRVVGASRRQVFGSVLAEAGLVGFASSAAGVGTGVAGALGLRSLLHVFGIDLPAGPLVFEPRTAIVGLVVGTGVTVAAALLPAAEAVRISPVIALNARRDASGGTSRLPWWGGVLTVAGAAAGGAGLGLPSVGLAGSGIACVFAGITMLAPALARPVAGLLGRPLTGLLGAAGKLGRENSVRNPRRTARTASALMIGMSLVSAISVFGASLATSVGATIANAFTANLIVTPAGSSGGIPAPVPAAAAAVPGVTATTTVYQGQVEYQQSVVTLTGVTTRDLSGTAVLRTTAGTLGALEAGELLLDTATAKSDHVTVGNVLRVKFVRTGSVALRVGGIFQANGLVGSYLVSDAVFRANFTEPRPTAVLVAAGGSGARDRVTRALAGFPGIQVQTKDEFEQSLVSGVNQLLAVVYALLALAVIIALIGIVNTLMLSVFERTGEIGLLRAVGMRRRQVRTMIRAEALIISVFGAVIGIVTGIAMGLALVSALRNEGVTQTSVPVTRLVVYLVISGVLGLAAATWPARRAARLDVLTAIATE